MKKENRQIFSYIFFGVVLFAIVMNFSTVLQFLEGIISLILPILLGLLIAFVLNVPMNGMERLLQRLFSKTKKTPKKSSLQGISLFLTLICILLVIVAAATMLIPTLISSVKSIYPLAEEKIPEWLSVLRGYNIDVSVFTDWISSLNMEKLSGSVGNVMSSVMAAASSTISVMTSGIFGMIIAIYILLSKNKLVPQVKKVIDANLKPDTAKKIYYVAGLTRDIYAKFLSGQCMEAIILGCLIFISFSILRLPYAALIGFLTSIFAFIPYIGAFASCATGAVLILLAEPSKVLLYIIVYFAVQFVENQFIYPHVVGGSVGLSPLWTLLAAMVGGKLFGLAGIIFFIPLAAVVYTLIREDTYRKLRKKQPKTVNES